MAIPNPFGRFFNDPDLEQIEGFINGILTTPSDNKEADSENISSEFINEFYKDPKEKQELDQIFSQFSIPAERLQKYGAYDEVYRSVQMIKRIIKVYKPYIIQKNPVSGSWYLLRKTDKTKEDQIESQEKEQTIAEDSKKFYKECIDNFQLQSKLKNTILHSQLIYGNHFVEVVNLKEEKEKVKDLSQVKVLNEAVVNKLKFEFESFNKNTSQLQIDSLIESVADQLVHVDNTIDKDELQSQNLKFKNTMIRMHKPHNIIILETTYGTVLGYLEVNRDSVGQSSGNVAQTLSNITNKLASSNGKDNTISDGKTIINKIINHILKKVNASRNSSGKTKYSDKVIDDLKRFLIEQNAQNLQMNLQPLEVRFIPSTRMVNFSLPTADNHPYGESLLESLMLPGKLYILSQLSNVMQKLSRAPVTRKWVNIIAPFVSNDVNKIW